MNLCSNGAGTWLPLAVIPTVTLAGPVAILALLFPAICAGLMLYLRRWQVTLSVLSLSSTVYLLHNWFYSYISQSWWENRILLWIWLTFIPFAGLMRCRNIRKPNCSATTEPGTLGDVLVFISIIVLCVGLVTYSAFHRASSLSTYLPLIYITAAGATSGLCTTCWLRNARMNAGNQAAWGNEPAVLVVILIACASFLARTASLALGAGSFQLSWAFTLNEEGYLDSSPVVVGENVFIAAALRKSSVNCGALFCVDRTNGKQRWVFSDDNQMKQVLSSPCYSAGRIYIGEGFHTDAPCKLYCVDAATGTKLWDFQTRSHTESTPRVVDGRVYFGAGDDGLYCVDSLSGDLIWHFSGPHVDGCPELANNRVYAGSGYEPYEVFCVETSNGTPIWRVPIELSSFASATVAGDDVFFGIGNGNLVNSDDKPSGALLCLESKTGRIKWKYNVADGVHAKPIEVGGDIVFVSRDQHCYCVAQSSGRLRWKRNLGSPIVSAPIIAGMRNDEGNSAVYVLTSGGMIFCLNTDTGLPCMTLEISDFAQVDPQFISSPAVTLRSSSLNGHYQLIIAGGVRHLFTKPALFCLE